MLRKNTQFRQLGLLTLAMVFSTLISFGQDQAPNKVLFKNVRVFNGVDDKLSESTHVLVVNNKIKVISENAADSASANATVIDGEGRVLMPGLNDTHIHISFASIPQAQLLFGDQSYNHIYMANDARDVLMRGITTIRDMGGNTFGLKRAIDEGMIPGPRIYPSGAIISQTGGHGDFRTPNQGHPSLGNKLPAMYQDKYGALVDGVPQMLAAARDNLRGGASQIKIATGGGYSSPADPLLGNQFTFDEIKAAVDVANNLGTYVTIHAYTPEAINVAIDAGIKDVGHGQLLDKATLERMAKEGVSLSTQPFTVCSEPQLDDFSNSKLAIVCEGTRNMYKWAKEIPDLLITYGTDIFFVPQEAWENQTKQMERLLEFFEPVEILKMATGNCGELYKKSGPMMNPYPGDLGVIKVGAYADMLLVEGNPLEDLTAVTDQNNLLIIMKDGKIYKNIL
jgi:imidazolonepropionase-like amidohydrolase